MATKPIDSDFIFDLPSISEPAIHPHGSAIAYVRAQVDRETMEARSHIELIPFTGGQPARLTAGPTDRQAGVVAGRLHARLPPRRARGRQAKARAAVAAPPRRRRGTPAHGATRRRAEHELGAGWRLADVRGRRRPRCATGRRRRRHPPCARGAARLLPRRYHRLARRCPSPALPRRRRHGRGASDHARRLRSRPRRLLAGRRDHRLRLLRPLGHSQPEAARRRALPHARRGRLRARAGAEDEHRTARLVPGRPRDRLRRQRAVRAPHARRSPATRVPPRRRRRKRRAAPPHRRPRRSTGRLLPDRRPTAAHLGEPAHHLRRRLPRLLRALQRHPLRPRPPPRAHRPWGDRRPLHHRGRLAQRFPLHHPAAPAGAHHARAARPRAAARDQRSRPATSKRTRRETCSASPSAAGASTSIAG